VGEDAGPEQAMVSDDARVAEVAEEMEASGWFAFDLEFASDGRFVPELSLMQVAWGATEEPEMALLDCLAIEPTPVLDLVASDRVETVAHAAKQDLGLLRVRHGVTARAFWDTQIAAAFLGLGNQIGYAKLVARLVGVKLDKGAQFTKWLRRPLSAKQLRYALNDVRYLPLIWTRLREELETAGRLAWVQEESEHLAQAATGPPPAELAFRELRGWGSLDPAAIGSLRALAAWRLRTAGKTNQPLSWVLPDRAMVDICRLAPSTARELKRVRGVGDGTVRRYAEEILEEIRIGASNPVNEPKQATESSLSARGRIWATTVANLIQSRCAEEDIAARFVGTRTDAEALVAWFEHAEDGDPEPDLPLLRGWRRELAGNAVLAWLRGDAVLAVGRSGPGALRLIETPSGSPD